MLLSSRRPFNSTSSSSGSSGNSPRRRSQSTQHQHHTPLSPLVRRLALLILAASYCTLLLLWSYDGGPDPEAHAVRYQALRYEGGNDASHPRQQQRHEGPVMLFEGANGLAVPLHLLGGGAKEGDAEEKKEESAAHLVDAEEGEAETRRVRAMEGGGEGPPVVVEEAAVAPPQQEQEQQLAVPAASWEWSAAKEAAHAEYGVKRFGLRPTAWTSGGGGCNMHDEQQELDFTLVSQTSPDRLWMLAHMCRRWEGPFVLAVYMQGFAEAHEAMLTHAPCPNARILRVRPPPRPSDDLSPEEAAEWDSVWAQPDQFPVNALRNLAIEEVQTSHFLLTDMDLWPARGMYRLLRRLAAPDAAPETRRAFLEAKQAFVAPAFGFFGPERLGSDGLVYPPDPEDVPGDMSALAACADKGECIVFDSQYNVQGHGTTDTGYWMERQGPTELHPIPCFLSNRYEPYLLLRRCPSTPPFAEAFTGYGKNKIEHVAHLRFRGFRFAVLPPGAFLIHFPHAPSKSKKSWLGHTATTTNNSYSHRERMDALYDHFLSWALQERAARAGETVRLCPPPPPVVPKKEGGEGEEVTSVALRN